MRVQSAVRRSNRQTTATSLLFFYVGFGDGDVTTGRVQVSRRVLDKGLHHAYSVSLSANFPSDFTSPLPRQSLACLADNLQLRYFWRLSLLSLARMLSFSSYYFFFWTYFNDVLIRSVRPKHIVNVPLTELYKYSYLLNETENVYSDISVLGLNPG